jgi:hypothetical protein
MASDDSVPLRTESSLAEPSWDAPVRSGLWCLLGRTLLGGNVICHFGIDVLPELDAAVDGVAVCAEDHVIRQVLHQFGVTPAKENCLADHAGLEAGDDVQDGFSPTPDTPTFEASDTDVLFVSKAFFIGQVSEFERDDDAVEDHRGAQAGAGAEEEHAAAFVTAQSLHSSVIDEAERFTESFFVRKIDPAWAQVMGLGDGTMVDDRAGVADGNTVVDPSLGGGEDVLGHLFRGHGGTGGNLDGDAVVGRGNLDVGAPYVYNQNFH